MMYDGYGGGMLLWFLLSLVVIVAVVIAVIFLVRGLGGPTQSQPPLTPRAPAESPREILKRRYAAGEIEREEYQQKLRDLE